VETVVRVQSRADEARTAGRVARAGARPEAALVTLAHPGEAPIPRIATGIAELDRVLGGGLVPGSLVLVGGEPGVG
jgi:DNA repair protein RadA/Sms